MEEIVFERGCVVRGKELFYLRESSPEMRKKAVNGIINLNEPFVAPWSDERSHGDYLNILSFSKGKVYYLENEKNQLNVVFPSPIKFKLVLEEGNTFVWECIFQKSIYKYAAVSQSKNYKFWIYFTIVLAFSDLVLFLIFLFTRIL